MREGEEGGTGRGKRNGEDERSWKRRGFQGFTFPVPEGRKYMAMHYLARPVLVLFIKEHGWSNTAAFPESKRRKMEELPEGSFPSTQSSSFSTLQEKSLDTIFRYTVLLCKRVAAPASSTFTHLLND